MGLKIEGKGEIPKALTDAVKNKKEGIEDVDLFPYRITNSGIFKSVPSKDNKDEIVSIKVCMTGFNIVAKGDNIDTKALLFKIVVKDLKGRNYVVWKSVGDLLTRTGILELMTKDQFAFKESNAHDMENLFETYIDKVKHELPEEITVSRSGWKNNNSLFVCGSTGYTKEGESTVLQLENNTADLYTQEGSIENWKTGVEKLFEYDAVRFKAYASCTPMLLSILGIQSFTVEQIGLSGMLKTLSHSVCASMFGNPKKLLLNARSTPKGIEAFVGYNTDLPTYIDETSTNPDEIKDLIYTITNGTGRGKSNIKHGFEMPQTWNTVVLTTGEHPILPSNAKMGQLVRVIPLKEGVTDHLEEDVIEDIEKAIRENHGLIRNLIIKEIFENKDKISDIYSDYFGCFKSPEVENDKGTKANTDARAKRFYAAIATAGYILENVFADIGIKQEDPFGIVNKYYTENVISASVFIPDHKRALSAFYSWFAANKKLFEENDEHSNHKVCGDIDKIGKVIYILPEELEEVITKHGYNFKGSVDGWKKEEILLTHPHSKKDPSPEAKWVKVINGVKAPVYKIKMQDTKAFEYEGEVDVDLKDDRERKPKYTPRPKKNNPDVNKNLKDFDVSKDISKHTERKKKIKGIETVDETLAKLEADGFEPFEGSITVSPKEMKEFMLETDEETKEQILIDPTNTESPFYGKSIKECFNAAFGVKSIVIDQKECAKILEEEGL